MGIERNIFRNAVISHLAANWKIMEVKFRWIYPYLDFINIFFILKFFGRKFESNVFQKCNQLWFNSQLGKKSRLN